MNEKEAIRRKKLYYEGLESVMAQPIPEAVEKDLDEIVNDPEQDEDYRTVLSFWKEVVGPLDVAIAFVHDNRVLPQEKDLVINDDSEAPFMQPGEIFDTLKYLMPFTVGEFLAVLKISSDDRKQLLDLVEDNNKEEFVSQLGKTHCDTMPLARLCSRCMGEAMAGLFMTEEERALTIDHLVGTFYEEEDNERARKSVAEMQSYYEREDDNPESTKQFYADFMDSLVNQLIADLHYYWNFYDIFGVWVILQAEKTNICSNGSFCRLRIIGGMSVVCPGFATFAAQPKHSGALLGSNPVRNRLWDMTASQ